MTTFTTTNASVEAVAAPIEDVWAAMVDADLLAELTPLIDRIEVQGEHWRWCLTTIRALGVEVAPCFTVAMTFREPNLIRFEHDPPAGQTERAGATGHYDLTSFDGGTVLDIEMEMAVELPLPKLSRGAVEGVMGRTTQLAGDRFFDNLLRHLGTRRVPVPGSVTDAA